MCNARGAAWFRVWHFRLVDRETHAFCKLIITLQSMHGEFLLQYFVVFLHFWFFFSSFFSFIFSCYGCLQPITIFACCVHSSVHSKRKCHGVNPSMLIFRTRKPVHWAISNGIARHGAWYSDISLPDFTINFDVWRFVTSVCGFQFLCTLSEYFSLFCKFIFGNTFT